MHEHEHDCTAPAGGWWWLPCCHPWCPRPVALAAVTPSRPAGPVRPHQPELGGTCLLRYLLDRIRPGRGRSSIICHVPWPSTWAACACPRVRTVCLADRGFFPRICDWGVAGRLVTGRLPYDPLRSGGQWWEQLAEWAAVAVLPEAHRVPMAYGRVTQPSLLLYIRELRRASAGGTSGAPSTGGYVPTSLLLLVRQGMHGACTYYCTTAWCDKLTCRLPAARSERCSKPLHMDSLLNHR